MTTPNRQADSKAHGQASPATRWRHPQVGCWMAGVERRADADCPSTALLCCSAGARFNLRSIPSCRSSLGNGNTVGATAAITHSDGALELNLAHNGFHRSFSNSVPLTEEALNLPEVGGAGWVRDLREAMSLGTAQAQVQAFATGATRAELMAWVASHRKSCQHIPSARRTVATSTMKSFVRWQSH